MQTSSAAETALSSSAQDVCIAPFRRDSLDLDKKTERTHSGFRSYFGCQSAFLSCRERVRRQLRCGRCAL